MFWPHSVMGLLLPANPWPCEVRRRKRRRREKKRKKEKEKEKEEERKGMEMIGVGVGKYMQYHDFDNFLFSYRIP